MQLLTYFIVTFIICASATPQLVLQAVDPAVQLQNGKDAIAQNERFETLTAESPCTPGEIACIDGSFALCGNGKFVLMPCSSPLICAALPTTDSPGTSVTCTTKHDLNARLVASGAMIDDAAPTIADDDPQKSLTLDPRVIATNFQNDRQNHADPGHVPSLTSSTNFMNFCLTVDRPLTDGQQRLNGSCNSAPMGVIPAIDNMPSTKFQFPLNQIEIEVNTTFTVILAISHLETGYFVNASINFYSAPQQVGPRGDIRGHSHFVIEKLDSLDQTYPTDPNKFTYFRGLNTVGSVLSANVTGGLDVGAYRIASITTAANHQPVLVPVAQHGSVDDMVYFTVKKGAKLKSDGE